MGQQDTELFVPCRSRVGYTNIFAEAQHIQLLQKSWMEEITLNYELTFRLGLMELDGLIIFLFKIKFISKINSHSLQQQSQNRQIQTRMEPQTFKKEQNDEIDLELSFSGSQGDNDGHVYGKWSDEENIKFVTYLSLKKGEAKSKEKRKSHKLFKQMSKYINSRTPQQCRSHFQKMMKKYKTMAKLRKYIRNCIGISVFDTRAEEIERELSEILEEQSKQSKEVSTQTDIPYFFMVPNFTYNRVPFEGMFPVTGFYSF